MGLPAGAAGLVRMDKAQTQDKLKHVFLWFFASCSLVRDTLWLYLILLTVLCIMHPRILLAFLATRANQVTFQESRWHFTTQLHRVFKFFCSCMVYCAATDTMRNSNWSWLEEPCANHITCSHRWHVSGTLRLAASNAGSGHWLEGVGRLLEKRL